jgi:hypothetical protein
MQEGLGRSPPQKGEFAGKVAFFVDSTAEVLYNTVSWVHGVDGKSCEISIIADGDET